MNRAMNLAASSAVSSFAQGGSVECHISVDKSRTRDRRFVDLLGDGASGVNSHGLIDRVIGCVVRDMMSKPRRVRSMLRIERTRRVPKERGPASGLAASVQGQRIRWGGFPKELHLAGTGSQRLLWQLRRQVYSELMTRPKSRRRSNETLIVAVGERVIRELRRHVSHERQQATNHIVNAIRANAKDLEAVWRALADEKE
jgi:hypothetical protein